MLAKLINGALSYAPKKIIVDGKTIFNPAETLLKEHGYKEIRESDIPDDAPDGKIYVPSYEDKGDYIEQVWTLIDEPPKAKEELAIELATKQINTLYLSDNEALYFFALYPTWAGLCEKSYKAKTKGFKFSYGDKLYKTVQDEFTFQSQWIPGQGTSAIYTQIVESQAGTLEDPIDVPDTVPPDSFTYVTGKYYRHDGVIYKCERDKEGDGVEHSFPYSPDALIGHYFTVV